MQNKGIELLRKFIKSYSPRDFFHRYELFKLLTLIFLLLVFTSITISAFDMNMLAHSFSISDFVSMYICNFLPRFWLRNWWYDVIAFMVFFALIFNVLKGFFFDHIEFIIPPKLLDPIVAPRVGRLNKILSFFLLFYMMFVAFPILHLFNLNVYVVLSALATLIVPLLYANLSKLEKIRPGYQLPLSTHTFGEISYKSASGGPLSEELREELRRYRTIKANAPVGADVLDFAAQSKDNKFKGFSNLFNQFETLFNPKGAMPGNLADSICLHNKTSDAIDHAIELVAGVKKSATTAVIYSDAEFLRVKEAIKAHQVMADKASGQKTSEDDLFYELALEKSLLDDTLNEEAYKNEIVSRIMAVHDKNPEVNVYCVVLTHIYHQTGRILKVKNMVEGINAGLAAYNHQLSSNEGHSGGAEHKVKVVYIVDGAQAVGNIKISEEILKLVHFYAVCGQKWLLGQYSMGILLRNDKLLTADGIKLYEEAADSIGEYEYTSVYQRSKSIPYEPYISTSIMLSDINHHGMDCIEKHNQNLAKSFVKGLYELNNVFEVVNDDCGCGIVTIRVNEGQNAKGVNDALMNKYGICGDLFEVEKGAEDKSNLIRFSFHYFMGDRDVNKLLYALLDVASGEG
jgi:hypothetical protein